MQPVLISGVWTAADADAPSFHAWNPSTGAALTDRFPISSGADLDRMGSAAEAASDALASADPDLIRDFLLGCAEAIEARRSEIARTAHLETGLPIEPRLAQVEFDRMIGQLRTAADAAADTSATGWRRPLSDGPSDIRSDRGPLGGRPAPRSCRCADGASLTLTAAGMPGSSLRSNILDIIVE